MRRIPKIRGINSHLHNRDIRTRRTSYISEGSKPNGKVSGCSNIGGNQLMCGYVGWSSPVLEESGHYDIGEDLEWYIQ